MADSYDSAFSDAVAEVFFLRWIFGWNLVVGWIMVAFLVGGVGYFIGFVYEFGLVGFLAGGPIWYLSTQYINEHYEPLRDGYLADVETFGPKVLRSAGADPDAEFFTLVVTPTDRPFLVEAPKQVDATVLAVGQEMLWIYDETTFDVMFLDATLGTDTDEVTEFAIADLESVTYADRELEIRTVDGETFYAPSSTEPTAVIETLRERMAGGSTTA